MRLAGAMLLGALLGACASVGENGQRSRDETGTLSIEPLAAGESGVALRCAKLLTMDAEDRVFDPGMIVVRDAEIEYVGEPIELPAGFPQRDLGALWVSPGMVDLHSHVQTGGWGDINDMVLPVNPELRVRPTMVPANAEVKLACAGGVTTLNGIPGSGTSISGFGLLYKTKTRAPSYQDCVLRDPGGMKVAQNFNPQRYGGDLGASWAGLAWNLERINDRALAAIREGRQDPALENLMKVHEKELPVLIHCASAEGVAAVARMWRIAYPTESVLSHGDWDGHLAAPFVAAAGMPVNHGPRLVNFNSFRREEKVLSTGLEFMKAGVPNFSLNTDASVIPQEELFLQGTMSARYGAEPYDMLRAVTSNPANSFQIGDRVGSLEPGKDADIVVSTGDPLDPRSHVELVFIDGAVQYDRAEDGQWF
jgi:imidazolonepropionase-like amidohydrolase